MRKTSSLELSQRGSFYEWTTWNRLRNSTLGSNDSLSHMTSNRLRRGSAVQRTWKEKQRKAKPGAVQASSRKNPTRHRLASLRNGCCLVVVLTKKSACHGEFWCRATVSKSGGRKWKLSLVLDRIAENARNVLHDEEEAAGEDVRHAVEVVEEDVHPVGNVPYEQIISGPADPEGGRLCRPSLPARFFQENLQTSVCKVL